VDQKLDKDELQQEEVVDVSIEGNEELSLCESEPVDEITLLKDKVLELEDRYLRANAEFDNLKKRLEKEKMQAISYAHEIFARDLLPVIDSLEMAILSGSNQEICSSDLLDKVREGLGLTIEQFRKAFEKHGIELVDMNGEFDPNFHEAVMQLESEGKSSGEILQVFQKGYKIKERILRPAMVSIVK